MKKFSIEQLIVLFKQSKMVPSMMGWMITNKNC